MAVALFFTFSLFILAVSSVVVALTVRHHWRNSQLKKQLNLTDEVISSSRSI